jgi:hypothetical protein
MSTAIEPVIEEVATNLDEAANAVRMLDARVMGAFSFGVATGIVIGFVWGHRYNKTKLRAEIEKEAEEEISQMREFFQQKVIALQGEAEKKQPAEEIVEERGYTITENEIIPDVSPTLEGTVVAPPPQRPLRPPVPIIEDPPGSPLAIPGWDYRMENIARSKNPGLPYIIHMDEFNQELPAYDKTAYTYYPVDDVLTDEDESIITNRDDLIGVGTLERFGHGSDDPNIVHVRNNRLQLHIEIDRLPNHSYEEDVMGLSHEDVVQDDSNS